jgi:MFS transporter, DHA2 family, multidrug resistance protein
MFVPINTAAFTSVEKEKLGSVSGLMNLFRNIGGSAGIAMVTTILARRSQYHQSVLVGHMTPLDPAYQQALDSTAAAIAAQGASATDAAAQAQGVVYGMLQKNASMLGVADTFWILSLLFLLMVPLAFLLKRTGKPEGHIMME